MIPNFAYRMGINVSVEMIMVLMELQVVVIVALIVGVITLKNAEAGFVIPFTN